MRRVKKIIGGNNQFKSITYLTDCQCRIAEFFSFIENFNSIMDSESQQ